METSGQSDAAPVLIFPRKSGKGWHYIFTPAFLSVRFLKDRRESRFGDAHPTTRSDTALAPATTRNIPTRTGRLPKWGIPPQSFSAIIGRL